MTKFISIADTDKLPEGARTISVNQVEVFYSKLVERWKPKSEIWALAFGANALGVLAAASGFHVNWHFRRILLLKKHGFFSTYLPNTIIPLVAVSAYHPMVQLGIYTNTNESITHLQTKAALGQLGLGLLQPLLFVPFSTFVFATRHFTIRIPSPLTDKKAFFRYWWRLYKPFRGHIIANATVQVLVTAYIIRMQDQQFKHLAESLFVNNDMAEIEQ